MTSHRQRNDRRKGPGDRPKEGSRGPRAHAPRGAESPAQDWIWGVHAVLAALANPQRQMIRRLVATPERAAQLEERFGPGRRAEVLDSRAIAQLLPQGAAHQGLALRADPPEPVAVEELGASPSGVLLMLDQVTDPHNVGAIFRSAAAFGARGVIVQDRHSPPLAGAVAKTAAGALDVLPHARPVNLSRALETLAELGWRIVGLDGAATTDLAEALDGSPTVLVLGSEGEGLRRLVAEHCDLLAKIPMPGGFESLNVSAAAAVALYAASRVNRTA
ncbi:MAG TPA: 23S rRNA (guanosine(2251)-2'-O)-methyltransferase RlmB [Caulobacteraceae bacterium]|nr:23S rRNA (guanosine(2251)-2'-O)-methyltransferase RlmB [Caulobacteraceae bacterium]